MQHQRIMKRNGLPLFDPTADATSRVIPDPGQQGVADPSRGGGAAGFAARFPTTAAVV